MGHLLTSPSPEAPALASVSITVPEGWERAAVPGAALAARAPRVEGHFQPNVVVTVARVGDAPLAALAAAGRAELAKLADLHVVGEDRPIELDGRPTVVREYAFTEASSGLGLYQLQLQTLVPATDGQADLVTLTATTSGGQLEMVATLREIALTLAAAPAPVS